MLTSEPAPSLLDDDRGAIMVMGIFMCSCLVGALWYLAGIGDALLYRERLQEGADAIAFSDAALHARGMNLLVLMNLIMAAILSVRVAVRVGKLACTVAAAIFASLAVIDPPLGALAAPCAAAAEGLEEVDNATKTPIDVALQALVKAQDGISVATPPIAQAAATEVGNHYALEGKHTAYRVSDPDPPPPPGGGLPVEHTRPKKLCDEAAAVITEINVWLVDTASGGTLNPGAAAIGKIMEGLVGVDTKYFCDLEGGASQPSAAAEFLRGAQARCKDLGNLDAEENKHSLEAEERWEKRCSELGVTCQSRDPKGDPLLKGIQVGQAGGPDAAKNQKELDRLRLERDEGFGSVGSLAKQKVGRGTFGTQQCESWAMDDEKQRQADHDELTQQQSAGKGGGGDGGTSKGTPDVAPMAVKDFRNGIKEGQFIGGIRGNATGFTRDSQLVRVGTFNTKKTPAQVDPENAKLPAWAQAEMFYDCAGPWGGDKNNPCNADDDAMWHLKWRPRLRRFNQPTDETLQILSGKIGSAVTPSGYGAIPNRVAQDAIAPAVGPRSNAALRRDLSNLIHDQAAQGVH